MKLLLTVARRTEVETALEAGADLVDVKDPARGSLGRPSPALLRAVVRRCSGRRPVSVALGDGPHDPEALAAAAEDALRAGAAYLKVGLARDGARAAPSRGAGAPRDTPTPPAAWRRAGRSLEAVGRVLASSGSAARLVAVTFADARPGDAPTPGELVRLARQHGADGVMLDTLGKRSGTVVEAVGRRRLERWAASARSLGLETALAGGLDEDVLPDLRGLGVDVVGVRGGACAGGRRGRLDAARCRTVRRAVDRATERTARPAASR